MIKNGEKPELDENIYKVVESTVLSCNYILKEPFRENEIIFLTKVSEKYIKMERESKISFDKLLNIVRKYAINLDEDKFKQEVINTFKNKIEI